MILSYQISNLKIITCKSEVFHHKTVVHSSVPEDGLGGCGLVVMVVLLHEPHTICSRQDNIWEAINPCMFNKLVISCLDAHDPHWYEVLKLKHISGKVMLDAIFCVLFLRRIIICHSNCFRNSTCQDLPLLARSRCHVNIKGSPLHSSHWWCWVFNVLQRKTIFPILTCDHFITVFGMFSVLDPAGLPCFLWAELSEGVCWCDRQPGLALHGQIYRYSEIIWDNLRSCLLQAQRLAVACLEGCATRFRWNEIKGRGIL